MSVALRQPRWFQVVCVLLWTWLGFGSATRAADRAKDRARGEDQILRAAFEFERLQADEARQIPAEILREAKGIAILRETRAGLILGGKGGNGIVTLKDGNSWRPPVVVTLREGSFGLQAGWQKATFFHLLMSDAAVGAFHTNEFKLGLGLRVTSGPRSVGDEAKIHSAGADVLVYADTGGLFGGLSVEGSLLKPDDRLNEGLYGRRAEAVLFGPVPAATAQGRALISALEKATQGGRRP